MSRHLHSICWICDRPIAVAGIEIIGQVVTGRYEVAHRSCTRALGELKVDLRRAEDAGRDLGGSRPA